MFIRLYDEPSETMYHINWEMVTRVCCVFDETTKLMRTTIVVAGEELKLTDKCDQNNKEKSFNAVTIAAATCKTSLLSDSEVKLRYMKQ